MKNHSRFRFYPSNKPALSFLVYCTDICVFNHYCFLRSEYWKFKHISAFGAYCCSRGCVHPEPHSAWSGCLAWSSDLDRRFCV